MRRSERLCRSVGGKGRTTDASSRGMNVEKCRFRTSWLLRRSSLVSKKYANTSTSPIDPSRQERSSWLGLTTADSFTIEGEGVIKKRLLDLIFGTYTCIQPATSAAVQPYHNLENFSMLIGLEILLTDFQSESNLLDCLTASFTDWLL